MPFDDFFKPSKENTINYNPLTKKFIMNGEK